MEIALGRSRAYSLFSRLALGGLTAEILPAIQAIPDLAWKIEFRLDGATWGDEAAAAHHRLFGLGVFPYQGLFLGADGLLGGAENERVLASYVKAGFVCGDADTAEHLGWQLGCLAFLCGAEADAWEDGRPQQAQRAGDLQRGFLAEHLLRWLPPLVSAIHRQGDGFYAAFADLLLSLATDHMAAVSDQSAPFAWQLQARELLLEDGETSLHQIARWLVTPVNSGFFFSRDEIGRLAAACELPVGFGDRSQMLGDLLHSAAHFGQFPALCAALASVFALHGELYDAWAHDLPTLSPWVTPWQERIAAAAGVAARLGAERPVG